MHNSKYIYNKLNELNNELENLKLQKEKIQKHYEKIKNNCIHEYVLIYDKGKDWRDNIVYKSCCLICDTKFYLDTFGLKKNKERKDICIIDITKDKELKKYEIVDLFLFERYETKKDIDIAKSIFNKYFNQNYDYKELNYKIKKEILEQFGIKLKTKIKTKNMFGEW